MKLDFSTPNHKTFSNIDGFFQNSEYSKYWDREVSKFYPYNGTDLGWESVENDTPNTFKQAWYFALGFMAQKGVTEKMIENQYQ